MGLASLGLVGGARRWPGSCCRGATVGSTAGTWDCGYARPTARMQYTGSSFGADAGEPVRVRCSGRRRHEPAVAGALPRPPHASRASCRTPFSTGWSLPVFRLGRAVSAAAARPAAGPDAALRALHPGHRDRPARLGRDGSSAMIDTLIHVVTAAALAAAAAGRDQQDQGLVRRPRRAAAAAALLRPAQAAAQGHGAQHDHDLGLPRRAGRHPGDACCWPGCWCRSAASPRRSPSPAT